VTVEAVVMNAPVLESEIKGESCRLISAVLYKTLKIKGKYYIFAKSLQN
jgi:hypothetical protein